MAEKFIETYMNPGTCYYREVQFKQEYCAPVCVRFTNTEVVVLGDYGSWVFQGNIRKPLEFFRGGHTNPGYWHEKLEAAPREHYERRVVAENIVESLKEDAEEYNVDIEDLKYLGAPRDSPESWYDYLCQLRDEHDWCFDNEYIASIVDGAVEEDGRYLRVCEFVQRAANIIWERELDKIVLAEPSPVQKEEIDALVKKGEDERPDVQTYQEKN